MSVSSPFPCDEAVLRAAPARAPCTASRGRWILVATVLGSSMVFIDGTVVNVALPALQEDLGASVYQVQWVVEAFALFLAALLLVGGAAGDRFGRRRMFALGTAIFTGASVGCALASSADALILARGLQGIGGAFLVPGSLAILGAAFDESRRGNAIGIWSGWSAITAALGPVLGGFLIDHLSWRWAFLINLPLGLVVLALAYWQVPESRDHAQRGPIDVLGALLATLALGGIVYALIESSLRGWSDPSVMGALVLGLAASTAFVIIERRHPAPMLPFALFTSRNFSAANIVTVLLYAALGGSLFFVPLNLIQVQRYSAAAAGAALLPFVLSMFLLSRWAGRLVDRFGARLPLTVGPALAAVGFLLFAVPGIGGSYWTTFFPAVLVLGLGMSISVAPLTTTVMNAVGRESIGVASGVNNAASRAASLVAVAAFGIVMSRIFGGALDDAVGGLGLSPDLVAMLASQREKLAAIDLSDVANAGEREAIRHAIGDAFVLGFRWVMAGAAALALGAAGTAWASIEGRVAAAAKR